MAWKKLFGKAIKVHNNDTNEDMHVYFFMELKDSTLVAVGSKWVYSKDEIQNADLISTESALTELISILDAQ